MPLISIILPTYNVEKYISRALESCINQTLKDIEIIVVDDKGQDKSIDIAKEYANRDDRIKIIDNITNKGTYEARNVGVRNANSELIMFLDPDDELELNACGIMYDAMLDSCIDFACCKFMYIKDKKYKLIDYVKHKDKLSLDEYRKYFEKNGPNYWGWNLANKIFRKSIYLSSIAQVDVQNEKLLMAEDALSFYLILSKSGNFVCFVDMALYVYHGNIESITIDKDKKEFVIREFDKIVEIFERMKHDRFKQIYLLYIKISCFYYMFGMYKNDIGYCYKYLEFIEKEMKIYKMLYIKEKLWVYRALRKTSIKNFMLYVFYKYKLKLLRGKN